jgi:hypothetical protein
MTTVTSPTAIHWIDRKRPDGLGPGMSPPGAIFFQPRELKHVARERFLVLPLD